MKDLAEFVSLANKQSTTNVNEVNTNPMGGHNLRQQQRVNTDHSDGTKVIHQRIKELKAKLNIGAIVALRVDTGRTRSEHTIPRNPAGREIQQVDPVQSTCAYLDRNLAGRYPGNLFLSGLREAEYTPMETSLNRRLRGSATNWFFPATYVMSRSNDVPRDWC